MPHGVECVDAPLRIDPFLKDRQDAALEKHAPELPAPVGRNGIRELVQCQPQPRGTVGRPQIRAPAILRRLRVPCRPRLEPSEQNERRTHRLPASRVAMMERQTRGFQRHEAEKIRGAETAGARRGSAEFGALLLQQNHPSRILRAHPRIEALPPAAEIRVRSRQTVHAPVLS